MKVSELLETHVPIPMPLLVLGLPGPIKLLLHEDICLEMDIDYTDEQGECIRVTLGIGNQEWSFTGDEICALVNGGPDPHPDRPGSHGDDLAHASDREPGRPD